MVLAATATKGKAMTADSRLKTTIFRAIIILLILVSVLVWLEVRDGEELAQNQPLIAMVQVRDIENTIAAAGSLKPSNFVDVGAQVSGQLRQLYVEVGDVVVTDQLLAEIDARVQESRVEASRVGIEALESQLQSRQASLVLAEATAARQEKLRGANATSDQDYETAMSSLANARASLAQLEKQIQQSRASLSTEETQLEFTRIYAPIAGTIVSIDMNEGRTLNASQQAPTILRVADLGTMTVETQVSEADIGNIARGMEVYFTTLGGGTRRWHGELRQILPTPVVENNVVLYTALFDVNNDDGRLLPEMTAQVYFVTSAARDVLTVPLGALDFSETTLPGADTRLATVAVVHGDGRQETREVTIGLTSRVHAQVISGLGEGDQVVAGIMQPGMNMGPQNQSGPPMRGLGGFR